jgi:iron complex transport system substrate-binding protein
LSRAALIALLAALAAGAIAAPKTKPAPAAGRFPMTVKDDSGRTMRFAAPPRRIVSLAPAHTETLYALGAGPRVVGADTYSDYPAAARAKARLNCWPHPPLEALVALKPDLVVVLTQSDAEIGQMTSAGLPVLKLFPKTYAETLAEIAELGRVTGTEARARQIVASMRARAAAVRAKLNGVRKPRLLYELDATDPQRPFVAGVGGFYGEVLAMAGGANIFQDVRSPSAQVSAEQVIARDPEVILLGDTRSPAQPQSPALVARRPGWAGIAAVKGRRVFPVDSNQLTRPGPRLVEGLETIARLLHPERFTARPAPAGTHR